MEVPAPATTPAPKPAAPAAPLDAYYRKVRQMNWELAKARYKEKGVKLRTQEYIRGRGTTAIVHDDVCMGCMHCFDNCAFEAITAVDRKFALPDYTYSSRKAVIVVDNCVGCEKCAIVCPVDAIDMITKFGWEVRDGKTLQTEAPAPPPRPAAPAAPPKPAPPAPSKTATPPTPKLGGA